MRYELTASLCPSTRKIVPARKIREGDTVYLVKECPEGTVKERLGKATFLERLSRFAKYTPPSLSNANVTRPMSGPCPFSCGLCPAHLSHTALLNVVVTNRCDLACFYCFFYADRAGFVYEPTPQEICEQVKFVADSLHGKPFAVQLTGGEPTVREDLTEIVRLVRAIPNVAHIQLNTHGIKFARLYVDDEEVARSYARSLAEAGVVTVYMSFDGVTPQTNPKNYWEAPIALKAMHEGGLGSVVLVPTVIRNHNLHEAWDIIKFATMFPNVLGVNYQPVSFTGLMPRKQREEQRVTISDLVEAIEEQSGGQVTEDDWYPVSITVAFSRFVRAFTGIEFELTNHPECGVATYLYVQERGRNLKVVPITRFIDVEGLAEYLFEKASELSGLPSHEVRTKGLIYVLEALSKFVDFEKAPEGSIDALQGFIASCTYDALAEFHVKFLYVGTMHFMDLYNFDVKRVMRCNIHYVTPDKRIVPFCAYNNLPDLYREGIMKKYARNDLKDANKYTRDLSVFKGREELKVYEKIREGIGRTV